MLTKIQRQSWYKRLAEEARQEDYHWLLRKFDGDEIVATHWLNQLPQPDDCQYVMAA